MSARTIESITQERRALNDPDDQFLAIFDEYKGRLTEKILKDDDCFYMDEQDRFEETIGRIFLQSIPPEQFKKVELIFRQLVESGERNERLYDHAYEFLGEQQFNQTAEIIEKEMQELSGQLEEAVVEAAKTFQ